MSDSNTGLLALVATLLLVASALTIIKDKALVPDKRVAGSSATHGSAPQAAKKNEGPNYVVMRRRITYGDATLSDVLTAMTERDVMGLSNSIHALYAMRIHRGVVHALKGMWQHDEARYPDFAWDEIRTPAIRIAIASTLNRIEITGTDDYLAYIREHQYDSDRYNRAQVAVALGFNGDPQDLDYLQEMSTGEDHYVSQSAITALSLAGGNRARDILIDIARNEGGTARGKLVAELLRSAYDWPPPELNPLSTGR